MEALDFRVLDYESPIPDLHPNEYIFQMQANGKRNLIIHKRDGDVFGYLKSFRDNRLESRGANQAVYINSLLDPSIQLVACSGQAGTGKSFLAVAAAIEQLHYGHYEHIKFAKPFYRAGNSDAIGTLPGDLDEKVRPYLHSYMDILKELSFDEAYLTSMIKKGTLSFEPIEFMRGRTFRNSFILLDEAQSLTWDELYLVISRLGEGSKLVLLGDLDQIDTDVSARDSGLNIVINSQSYKQSMITASHTLDVCCRSEVAKLSHDINKEFRTSNN